MSALWEFGGGMTWWDWSQRLTSPTIPGSFLSFWLYFPYLAAGLFLVTDGFCPCALTRAVEKAAGQAKALWNSGASKDMAVCLLLPFWVPGLPSSGLQPSPPDSPVPGTLLVFPSAPGV